MLCVTLADVLVVTKVTGLTVDPPANTMPDKFYTYRFVSYML